MQAQWPGLEPCTHPLPHQANCTTLAHRHLGMVRAHPVCSTREACMRHTMQMCSISRAQGCAMCLTQGCAGSHTHRDVHCAGSHTHTQGCAGHHTHRDVQDHTHTHRGVQDITHTGMCRITHTHTLTGMCRISLSLSHTHTHTGMCRISHMHRGVQDICTWLGECCIMWYSCST